MELLGKPVADKINEELKVRIDELSTRGIIPTLAVVRVGQREDDLSYERGLLKKFESMNCKAQVFELSENVTQEELESQILELNSDNNFHGILMFRPLPKHLSSERIEALINPLKDVDAMGAGSLAYTFSGGKGDGFYPCTAQAVMELLDYYDINLKGAKVTVVGRSLVIGKPVAMMLLNQNATVKICHTKTLDLKAECLDADIIVVAAGKAGVLTKDFVKPGQVIIDVGMNVDDNGKLCGDCDYNGVSPIVDKITPVPRGVGSVTTSVLLKHVVCSASKME